VSVKFLIQIQVVYYLSRLNKPALRKNAEMRLLFFIWWQPTCFWTDL